MGKMNCARSGKSRVIVFCLLGGCLIMSGFGFFASENARATDKKATPVTPAPKAGNDAKAEKPKTATPTPAQSPAKTLPANSDRPAVSRFVLKVLSTNCYLIACPKTKKCLLVDVGSEGQAVAEKVKQLGFTPELIFCTHGHSDHVSGLTDFIKVFPDCKIVIHANDSKMALPITDRLASGKMGRRRNAVAPDAPKTLKLDTVKQGDELTVGEMKFKVLETPGHTPGGISLYFAGNDKAPGFVFSGDALFKQTVGRTDLAGGDSKLLIKSIKENLLTLPDQTKVYPGHGPDTTVGFEKKHNEFLK